MTGQGKGQAAPIAPAPETAQKGQRINPQAGDLTGQGKASQAPQNAQGLNAAQAAAMAAGQAATAGGGMGQTFNTEYLERVVHMLNNNL